MFCEVDRLESLVDEVDSYTQPFDEVVGTVETRLRRRQYARLWLDRYLPPDDVCLTAAEHGNEWTDGFSLGYDTVAGEWCLAIRPVRSRVDFADNLTEAEVIQVTGDAMPLSKAPRHLRIEASREIGLLLTALSEREERYLELMERAIERFRQ